MLKSVLLSKTLYLKPPWWKNGYVVAIKIEKHQLLCTGEGLGMDGFYGISLQIDALDLWN